MKILILGGYSYLGVNISEKFIVEKHQLTVIDTLVKGQKSPLKSIHKFFNLKAEDPECRKVFEASAFDVVIFISGSLEHENNGTSGSDMGGITNIANLSAEMKVKKFIVLTSASIYGNAENQANLPFTENSEVSPVTAESMGDNVREYYAIKIGSLSKMPVLILRISDVYGPCIVDSCENLFLHDSGMKNKNLRKVPPGRIIPDLIERAVDNKTIAIEQNPESTMDFIYIDDAVSAVYKAALAKNLTGIFNISSDTETSFLRIAEIISGLKKIKPINFEKSEKSTSPARLRFSNENLKKAIEWQPEISIKDGLQKCIEARLQAEEILKNKKARSVKKDKSAKKTSGRVGRTALAVFENLLLFMIFAFLQWGELFFNINLPDAIMDYSIIYIIIAAVIWGQVQAYIAMLLSSALFIAVSIFTGTDIIAFVYTPENLVRLSIYLLVGIITGYAIERRNREIESREIAFEALSGKYSFLLDVYNQTRLIKSELESQVIDTEDSFSAIYETIQKVESLEIEAVYSGAISAIEKIMKTDSVSIYIIGDSENSHFMRLKARSAGLSERVPNSINIKESAHFRDVIEGRCNYVNRDFEPLTPIIIAPVIAEKKVIAVISIHNAEFENLTSHYENLFSTVINLITNAIKRAYYFGDTLQHRRYIENTKILNAETFVKILSEVRKYKDELDMSYSLLSLRQDGKNLTEISESVSMSIRDNDYIGIGDDSGIYVLLSNTKNNYAHIVIERLSGHGIESSLVREETIDV